MKALPTPQNLFVATDPDGLLPGEPPCEEADIPYTLQRSGVLEASRPRFILAERQWTLPAKQPWKFRYFEVVANDPERLKLYPDHFQSASIRPVREVPLSELFGEGHEEVVRLIGELTQLNRRYLHLMYQVEDSTEQHRNLAASEVSRVTREANLADPARLTRAIVRQGLGCKQPHLPSTLRSLINNEVALPYIDNEDARAALRAYREEAMGYVTA